MKYLITQASLVGNANLSKGLTLPSGALRYIKTLRPWPLNRVMTEKYLFSTSEADDLCSFLEPMLAVDQRERKEVRDMVDHHWLDVKDEEWVGVDGW